MNEAVRELTSKELIEQSDCSDKELILSRLRAEDYSFNERLNNYEEVTTNQRNIIESYRTVLQDMIYSNWLNR